MHALADALLLKTHALADALLLNKHALAETQEANAHVDFCMKKHALADALLLKKARPRGRSSIKTHMRSLTFFYIKKDTRSRTLLYIYIYIYIYVCMYVCVYIYIYVSHGSLICIVRHGGSGALNAKMLS